MIELTPAARQQLDDYMQRLSAQLRETRAEVAGEVEQSVREHIEIALENAQTPVTATDMIAILDRLGSPEQWLDADEQPPMHTIDEVRTPPDDSRLPYISFALVLIAIATFMFFGFLLLIPAMFVSRAWIEQKRERGEALGSRRWVAYPAIALVLALASLLLFAAPPLFALATAVANDARRLFDVPTSAAGELRFMTGLRALTFGSWWIIAAALCAALIQPIRFVFLPLLDGLQRRHFALLAAIGALLAAAGGALIYYRH